jgi:S1-C subfamily serine protease
MWRFALGSLRAFCLSMLSLGCFTLHIESASGAIIYVEADSQFEFKAGAIAIMPPDCRSPINCAPIAASLESIVDRNRKSGPLISSAAVVNAMQKLKISELSPENFSILANELKADTFIFPVYAYFGPAEDSRVVRILGRNLVGKIQSGQDPTVTVYAISRSRDLAMFAWASGDSLLRTDGRVFVRLTEGLAERAFTGRYTPIYVSRLQTRDPNPKKPIEIPTSAITFATGTGFTVRPDGFLLTSNHVVSEAGTVFVTCRNLKRTSAIVVGFSKRTDLALLKIEQATPNYLTLAPIRSGQLGDPVFTVGYPVTEILGHDPKFTDGTISALSGVDDEKSFLQISVPIQPGNSGGPLVNDRGEVLGVVAATAAIVPFLEATDSLPQNVNFAVKGEYARVLYDPPPSRPPALNRREAIARTEASLCFVESTR